MVTKPSPTSSPRPDSNSKAGERLSGSQRRGVTAPPVLASEALREDVAPLCPWSGAFRVWDGVLGLVVALAGLLIHLGVWRPAPGGPWIAYVVGAALILLGALPLPYVARGVGSLALGMVVVVMGMGGIGPLADVTGTGRSPLWALLYVLAGTALAAALLFRARYREYLGARVTLLVAMVFSLPAVAHAGVSAATGPLGATITSGLVVLVIIASLLGFMGDGTTTISTIWAVVVIAVLGFHRMAEPFWAGTGWDAYHQGIRAGLILMVACTLTSKGLFQLLAAAFAPDARRVDVLRSRQPSLHRASGIDG